MTDISPNFDPVQMRRDEVAAYDANIAIFKDILKGLPQEWPTHLAQFSGRKDHHAAIAEVDDIDDVELVSKLLYMEQLKTQIRTEIVERTKAASILAALEAKQ